MIKLSIEIVSPLTPDDRDLLSGIAVMTLAIANRELAAQGFPETFPEEPEPQPVCGATDEAFPRQACVSPAGHRGRHKYRPVAEPVETNGLVN